MLSLARVVLPFLLLALVAPASLRAAEQSLIGADAAWTPVVSDGASVRTSLEPRSGGEAGAVSLRIDFDFTAGAGFGGATLALPIALPENYEFAMTIRGEGPANNLEFKLIDDTDLNVWWVNRRGFDWPAQAQRLISKRRHFSFAWGPSHGQAMSRLGRIELIIAASEGGKGTVWIDELTFRPLPLPQAYTATPTASASSTSWGEAASVLSGDGPGGGWAGGDSDRRPVFTIDFGQVRELGGLVLSWLPKAPAIGFTIESSGDGQKWTTLRSAIGVDGIDSYVALPDLETRWLRITLDRAFAGLPAGLRRVEVLSLAEGASPNALWAKRASRAPRGIFPRSTLGEQSFWTVAGLAGDGPEVLINEEGAIELDKRGPTIEPVLLWGIQPAAEGRPATMGQLLTWADGRHEATLHQGWMPLPTVRRVHEQAGAELEVHTLVAGQPENAVLHTCYTVFNRSDQTRRGKLVLVARPWQVLPPWQDLHIAGGWAPLSRVQAIDGGLELDGRRVVSPNYVDFAALTFDQGDPLEWLRSGRWPASQRAACSQRAASGMISFEFELAPGKAASYLFSMPLGAGRSAEAASVQAPINRAQFEQLRERVAATWRDRIGRTNLRGPAAAQPFIDTVRAQQAYILVNHDGKGFQPGSRTYERSWIRDGAMTSAAMLELGHPALVRDFIDWYAPFQFPSGKVPCVVDRRGADPVPEHDSHGQLIWLIATYYRYTGDRGPVERHFERVRKAVEYMQSLRRERMTDEFGPSGPARQEPGKPPVPAVAFRGLFPESISHEGYSAKPMHSFWDTLFGLRGLEDAAYLAGVMDQPALATEWKAEAAALRESIIASIREVHKAHGIDYLPGCVELGDFDSTSSTILLWPVEELERFPRAWVDATFDRYWAEFNRRNAENTWEGMTPYELRHVNAYVRLGQRDRAIAVLDWLFTLQRPTGWRHWAEVAWRVPTTPRMIGDMPHTWCGSDFLNAARAMLLYEDHPRGSLVLFAALPEAWAADPKGFAMEGMPTEFGTLTASIRQTEGSRLEARLSGTAKPPSGIEITSPRAAALVSASVNGSPAKIIPGERGGPARVLVPSLPATVEFRYE
jgi:hypothetical protein